MPCRSASGYPAGTPVRGPPGPGPPGGPGAPPGARLGPPVWAPKMGPFGAISNGILQSNGGSRGSPPGCTFWAPGPRGARGAKKCTFFWVFNNSPSRDSFGDFFWAPRDGPKWGYPGSDRWVCRLGPSLWDHIPHHAQHVPAWAGAVREHGCDGTRSRLFCASGGYVAMRKSTSLKARDGSPAQGCRRCERGEAVCESQTRPEPRSAARGPP